MGVDQWELVLLIDRAFAIERSQPLFQAKPLEPVVGTGSILSWMEIAEDKGLIPIRVLVADDHEAMLGRVAKLLAIEFNVVGTVTDGQQALDATLKLSPDVLVLDISMPVMNGMEVARRLKSVGSEAHIVFLTMHDDPDFVRKALEVGALGYVIKSRLASDLVTAVREAHSGRSFLSPTLPPF